MSERLILLGVVVAGLSGVPGLCANRRKMTGQRVTTALAVLGAGLGLVGVAVFWITGRSDPIALPWCQFPGFLPEDQFSVAVDGLSSFFLVPIFLVSLLGSIYGLGYWR